MAAYSSLAQLGMDSVNQHQGDSRQDGIRNGTQAGKWSASNENLDFFKEEKGLRFAGTHLILDFWNADNLDNLDIVEQALRDSVDAAGATLLHIHLHHFTPNGGISGVAVLSESHISIHSWPERGYAALDVFMCGDAEPYKAIAVLKNAFGGECTVNVVEHKRGMTA